MSLNDAAVLADTDITLPLGIQRGGIVRLIEKAPDVLPRRSHGAVRKHQKLDHVAGIIMITFHRQQIVACDGKVDRLHAFPLSLMLRTAQPYRAISRAFVIRLNASVSVTSTLDRSLSATPEVSA